MDYLLRILNESITGIIYFAALIILFLKCIKKKYDIKYIKDRKDLMLYFVILIVFISRIMGGIAQSILGHFISFVYPNTAIDIQKSINSTSIPQNILEMKNNVYGTLLFYRHLCISIILLGISLIIWFEEYLNKIRTFIVTTIISLIIGLAYYLTRQDYISIRDAIDKKFAP